MAVKAVEAIATAISEGFKLLGKVMSGAEKRRMRSAIEIGEKFIRHYEKTVPVDQQDKKLKNYARDFFKVNN